jgi:hypothetical protein
MHLPYICKLLVGKNKFCPAALNGKRRLRKHPRSAFYQLPGIVAEKHEKERRTRVTSKSTRPGFTRQGN